MTPHPTAFPRNEAAFPKLDDRQLAELARFAKGKSFAPGETLIAAGDRNVRFYIVRDGAVDVIDQSTEPSRFITTLGPREFTGDVDLLAGRPSVVDAIARTQTDTLEISTDELKRILNDLPRLSDLLLRAFLMRRQLLEETGFAAVRVIGSRYSRDTHRIREFLAKNKIPYNWIDLENDPQVEGLLARFEVRSDQTPVVLCSGARLFRNPSNTELADCLGIRRPIERTLYDLVIIGAGPAGLAAAVYGASEGLKTLLLDKIGPGGQAGTSSKIENYMGFPTGLSGNELASRAVVQAEKFGASLSTPLRVTSIGNEGGYQLLHLDSGEEVMSKCALICSGATYRSLNIPNYDHFDGAGVYHAATAVEAPLCRNAQVVVVGGGNSAGQAAVFLAEQARKVLLVIRGGDLGKDMSHYLVRRVEQTPKIEVRRHTEVTGLHGDGALRQVNLTNNQTQQTETIDCPAVFVFIGAVPHTSWVPPAIRLDPKGFVLTGQQALESGAWPLQRQPLTLETTVPGIFAAGDVRLGSIKRVASAVGEGSMAVQFVHQFLAGSQKEGTSQAPVGKNER